MTIPIAAPRAMILEMPCEERGRRSGHQPRTAVAATGLLVLGTACGRLGFEPIGDRGGPDGYAYRRPIVITSLVGTALDDFPVSVVLVDDAGLVTHARADARDLVFADDRGEVLAHEVVSYDAARGMLDAWVALPQLPPEPTTIWLYYGGPVATAASPWSSRYAGVWHMDLAEGRVRDSARGHDAVGFSAPTTPQIVAGIVGSACGYDGSDDTLVVGDPGDGSLDFGLGSFAFSVWVHVTQSVGQFDVALFKGGSSVALPGYDLELGSGTWSSGLSDGTLVEYVHVGFEVQLVGAWIHAAVVVDRPVARSYVNSMSVSEIGISGLGSLDSTEPLELGRNSPFRFAGTLDEVRIYTVPPSADWIAAEYANLARRGEFVTIGAEQVVPR